MFFLNKKSCTTLNSLYKKVSRTYFQKVAIKVKPTQSGLKISSIDLEIPIQIDKLILHDIAINIVYEGMWHACCSVRLYNYF